YAFDAPLDTNGTMQGLPEKDERGEGIAGEFLAFTALVIREKDKAASVHPTQQDNARGRFAIQRRGGNRHRIRFGQILRDCQIVPALKHDERVWIGIPFIERLADIVNTKFT